MTLKEVKARGRIRGEMWRNEGGVAKTIQELSDRLARVAGERWEECAELKVEEILENTEGSGDNGRHHADQGAEGI